MSLPELWRFRYLAGQLDVEAIARIALSNPPSISLYAALAEVPHVLAFLDRITATRLSVVRPRICSATSIFSCPGLRDSLVSMVQTTLRELYMLIIPDNPGDVNFLVARTLS